MMKKICLTLVGLLLFIASYAVAPITGPTAICSGSTATLIDTTAGGIWTSANPTIATIDAGSGVLTGMSAGTTTITYTVGSSFATTTITVNPLPTPYLMTGGGSYCVGGWGVHMGLAASNPGYSYQLYVGTTPVGIAFTGTGASIDFGLQTIAGTYTAIATNASTGCTASMTGMAVVSTTAGSCSGTPVAGSAMAYSSTICSGSPVGLHLSETDFVCGTTFQWQSSPDGTTWAPITGASTDAYTHYPTSSTYYKCVVTCPMSGLSAVSLPVHVDVHHYIGQMVLPPPTTDCNQAHFYLNTCSPSHTYNVTTWYGDGTSHNDTLTGGSYFDSYHTYAYPGSYSVKQVLYDGTTPLDSSTFSYHHVSCHTLPLFFYVDNNHNCAFDSGDTYNFYPLVKVAIDSNGIPIDTVSIFSGYYYKALGLPGTVYSFRLISDALRIECPSSGIIRDTISAGYAYYSKFVPIECGASAYDLSVNSYVAAGRHTQSGAIVVGNSYCPPTHATVTLYHSPRYVLTSGYTWPLPASSTATSITWSLDSLSVVSGTRIISYRLEVPSTWLTPGDTVNTRIEITPTTGDVDTLNNVIVRTDTVTSSYDPNEISVSPKGAILPCTPLEYTIHFENTGNAPAENIAVLDTLPSNLDPKTLDIVSSSAAMNLAIIKSGGYNIAKFDFPGIHLLDSSHHGQCTGFVIFKIKVKNGLPDGTSIPNRAGIYFDDNEVVMTNSVANIIGINPINGLDAVCTGSSITLTTANVGGAWSASNTHAALALGLVTGIDAGLDTIRYTMSNSCATKTAVKIVSVNTAPDAGTITGGNTVCAGSNITLSDAAGPGTWSSTNPAVAEVSSSGVVNGLGEGTAFIRYTRTNSCGTTSALTSMTVNPTPIPSVAISGNPGVFIGEGQSDTLIATVINGGATPTYQWAVNGVNVPGANTYFYVTDSLANNDSVSCLVTSGGDCGGLSTFNSVIVKVAPAGVGTIASANTIGIQPNPNKGSFVIKGTWNKTDESVTAEITNMLGQVVWTSQLKPAAGKISKQIAPDRQLADGVYLLNLRSASENRTIRFVVEK